MENEVYAVIRYPVGDTFGDNAQALKLYRKKQDAEIHIANLNALCKKNDSKYQFSIMKMQVH